MNSHRYDMLLSMNLEKDPSFHANLAPVGYWQSLASLGLWLHNFSLCLHFHMAAFSSICVCV